MSLKLDKDPRMVHASVFYNNGDLAKCRHILETMLQEAEYSQASKSVEILWRMAMVALREQKFEEAEVILNKVLSIDSLCVQALQMQFMLWEQAGNTQAIADAVAEIEKHINNDDSLAMLVISANLNYLKNANRAIEQLLSLAKRNDTTVEYREFAANLLLSMKRYEEAETVVKKALKFVKDDMKILAALAYSLAMQDKEQELIPVIEKLAPRTRDNSEVAWLIGQVYEKLGQNANALKAYQNGKIIINRHKVIDERFDIKIKELKDEKL
ncbi:MAG: hypothetical protein JW841_12800 [Deltaproteobacteria bacterium]|nr:hypothetical protein [Deltaproteobacteria bacterium]